MRLHSVEFENYRRFRQKCSLIVDDPIVALVGPNEAGKTSILNAITKGVDKNSFDVNDISQGVADVGSNPLATFKFLLEDDDLAIISEIPHSETPKWLFVKQAAGRRTLTLSPMPGRDPEEGKKVQSLIQFVISNGRAAIKGEEAKGSGLSSQDPIHRVLVRLQRDLAGFESIKTRPLSAVKLESFDLALQYLGVVVHGNAEAFIGGESNAASAQITADFLRDVNGIERGKYAQAPMKELARELSSLKTSLSANPPANAIMLALMARIPKIVKFTEEDRALPGSFDLNQGEMPRCLASLLRLARLDSAVLAEAVLGDRHLKVAELTDQANLALREAFQAWRQDAVWPSLYISNKKLHILVRAAHGTAYTDLNDRSEGFRQFIALVACVNAARYWEKDHDGGVIVVIDEAENHLHYDAQADLIDVFTKQRIVKQIIYSTHSAGCLPEDIGTGVRVVHPTPGTSTSVIRNWFWSEGAGFSPLLISMGAASLAFASVRRVVMTEGPSDMLLLPSLLREATGLVSLGYQVAPGLSEVSPRLAGELDLEAARSCFLLDGDPGGTALSRKLQESGVAAARILFLGGEKSGLVLEDLVDGDVYRACVNELLDGDGNKIPEGFELPSGSRYSAVKGWCEQRDVSVPGKRLIAQTVARRARKEKVLSQGHVSTVCELHAAIDELLNGRQ
ncbi:AAA family ATPase [Streptomyces sp. NPDC001228]|uniref:AAA family ATPase n=1 Tax=Streptomyces sp. NPDC001228 TaxID=3154381 RepID=UPI00332732A0